nr:hypothetical protein [Tanacetum cinerariifolium]
MDEGRCNDKGLADDCHGEKHQKQRKYAGMASKIWSDLNER